MKPTKVQLKQLSSRKTNIELVNDYMDFGSALRQAFVLEAVDRYAKLVNEEREAMKKEMKNHVINPDAWIACADDWNLEMIKSGRGALYPMENEKQFILYSEMEKNGEEESRKNPLMLCQLPSNVDRYAVDRMLVGELIKSKGTKNRRIVLKRIK